MLTPTTSTMTAARNSEISELDTKSSSSQSSHGHSDSGEEQSEQESVKMSIPEVACCSTDPSDWFPVNKATASFWLKQGPHSCKNENTAINIQRN